MILLKFQSLFHYLRFLKVRLSMKYIVFISILLFLGLGISSANSAEFSIEDGKDSSLCKYIL